MERDKTDRILELENSWKVTTWKTELEMRG